MKNLLTATLPALALLALGGCATSGALTSTTESDGVYYSSQDKTTSNSSLNSVYSNRGYNQSVAGSANPDGFAYGQPRTATGASTAPAPATTDDANPDYQGGTVAPAGNSSTLGTSSDYYVDNSATSPSGFGVPYSGPGVSTYNYTPSWSVSPSFYGSPFGYGMGLGIGYGYGGFGGFGSPYGAFGNPYTYSGFYDPFYSPFYSPFGYGYGSGISLGFGYGGFGGFGYPFGGYYGGYSPYYGGGYGGGYGYRSYGSAAPGVYGDARSSVLVGPRGSRGGMVMGAQPNGTVSSGANAPVNVGAGRRGGGMVLGANGMAAPTTSPTMNSMGQPNVNRGAFSGGALGQPAVATPGGVPAGATAGGRRGGFFSGFFGGGANGAAGGQRAQMAQPQNNGGYAPQPRQYNQQPSRSFSQPSFSQPSRSFSQPSFSQPSRSFSQPSGGGFGGGGGGSFGGGGGGGRRGGR